MPITLSNRKAKVYRHKVNIGDQFGLWRVSSLPTYGVGKYRKTTVPCRCECGTERTVDLATLSGGHSVSCGCLMRIKVKNRRTTHGGYKTRVYRAWIGIKMRCFNQNVTGYHRYGGRGISVCDEWLKFETFRDWALSSGYRDDLVLDRVDVDGNYCPENCEWITRSENTKRIGSSRDLRIKELVAQNKKLAELNDELQIKVATLEGHIALGERIADLTYGGTTE